jgi:osmotically-inducible protein OsmY
VSEVQRVIGRSERLPSRDNIRVELEGPAVVLRGTVADEHEARLAEALARLTPGVRDLRNELTVRGGGPAATGP